MDTMLCSMDITEKGPPMNHSFTCVLTQRISGIRRPTSRAIGLLSGPGAVGEAGALEGTRQRVAIITGETQVSPLDVEFPMLGAVLR